MLAVGRIEGIAVSPNLHQAVQTTTATSAWLIAPEPTLVLAWLKMRCVRHRRRYVRVLTTCDVPAPDPPPWLIPTPSRQGASLAVSPYATAGPKPAAAGDDAEQH